MDSGGIDSGIEIVPLIFLGDAIAADNSSFFRKKGICYVLNCSRSVDNHFSGTMVFGKGGVFSRQYLRLNLDDVDYVNISSVFNRGVEFISTAEQQKRPILVHCAMGQSRSVTLLLAFLMKVKKMTLQDAFSLITRKCAEVDHETMVNDGFKKALMKTELELFSHLEDNTINLLTFGLTRRSRRSRTTSHQGDEESTLPAQPPSPSTDSFVFDDESDSDEESDDDPFILDEEEEEEEDSDSNKRSATPSTPPPPPPPAPISASSSVLGKRSRTDSLSDSEPSVPPSKRRRLSPSPTPTPTTVQSREEEEEQQRQQEQRTNGKKGVVVKSSRGRQLSLFDLFKKKKR